MNGRASKRKMPQFDHLSTRDLPMLFIDQYVPQPGAPRKIPALTAPMGNQGAYLSPLDNLAFFTSMSQETVPTRQIHPYSRDRSGVLQDFSSVSDHRYLLLSNLFARAGTKKPRQTPSGQRVAHSRVRVTANSTSVRARRLAVHVV